MAVRREIREQDLLEYARCLLRNPEQIPYLPSVEAVASQLVAKAMVLHAFEKGVPSISKARELYEVAWKEATKDDPGVEPGLRGLGVARRLVDMLSAFTVERPITKYSLAFSRASVVGEYGVVSSGGKPNTFRVLRFHTVDDTHNPRQACDLLSYARWVHLQNNEPNQREIKVLNFSLTGGKTWLDSEPDELFARNSIQSVLNIVLGGQYYPAPGAHCANCLTHSCSESKLVALMPTNFDRIKQALNG